MCQVFKCYGMCYIISDDLLVKSKQIFQYNFIVSLKIYLFKELTFLQVTLKPEINKQFKFRIEYDSLNLLLLLLFDITCFYLVCDTILYSVLTQRCHGMHTISYHLF